MTDSIQGQGAMRKNQQYQEEGRGGKMRGAEGHKEDGAEEGPNQRECHAQGEEQGRSQDLHWGHPPLGAIRERRARKKAKGEGATQPLRKQGRWMRDP